MSDAEQVLAIAKILRASEKTIALTGAGVSTDSGIPDFRGDHGLWRNVDPMAVASKDGFEADPARFWRFWATEFPLLASAKPGPVHALLSKLEQRSMLSAVVTQNIDGLHQKAGSQSVYEVHGTFAKSDCLSCGHIENIEPVFARVTKDPSRAPACDRCGSRRIKPRVVLFGELLPPAFADAELHIKNADVLIVLGSSLTVHPVSGLIDKANARGVKVIIVNREATPFDAIADVVFRGELSAFCEAVGRALDI